MSEITVIFYSVSGIVIVTLALWTGWLAVLSRRDSKRLAELAHLNALDSRKFWQEHERRAQEWQRIFHDMQSISRMIFERVDKGPHGR